MSNEDYWDDDNLNEDNDQNVQGGDSKAIKALRTKAKADGAKISDLEAKLEKFTNAERDRSVKEVLEKKGVNPKAMRLILKDVADPTEENVDAWLKDNAELFNLKVAESKQEEPTENTENFDELHRQDALTSQAVSPGTGDNVKTTINAFKTFAEIDAWAKSQQ